MRPDPDLERGRLAAKRVEAEGGDAMAQTLACIEAAFGRKAVECIKNSDAPSPNGARAGGFVPPKPRLPARSSRNERIVSCEACGSEGRYCIDTGIVDRHTGAPLYDYEDCPWCEGTGGEIIETQPITQEDLDDQEDSQ